jgi:hypothetical protein
VGLAVFKTVARPASWSRVGSTPMHLRHLFLNSDSILIRADAAHVAVLSGPRRLRKRLKTFAARFCSQFRSTGVCKITAFSYLEPPPQPAAAPAERSSRSERAVARAEPAATRLVFEIHAMHFQPRPAEAAKAFARRLLIASVLGSSPRRLTHPVTQSLTQPSPNLGSVSDRARSSTGAQVQQRRAPCVGGPRKALIASRSCRRLARNARTQVPLLASHCRTMPSKPPAENELAVRRERHAPGRANGRARNQTRRPDPIGRQDWSRRCLPCPAVRRAR